MQEIAGVLGTTRRRPAALHLLSRWPLSIGFFSAFLWGISPGKTASVGNNRIRGYIHVYPMSACNIHYKTQELKRAEVAISCTLFNYFFKDVTFLEVPCRSRMLTAITAFGLTAIL